MLSMDPTGCACSWFLFKSLLRDSIIIAAIARKKGTERSPSAPRSYCVWFSGNSLTAKFGKPGDFSFARVLGREAWSDWFSTAPDGGESDISSIRRGQLRSHDNQPVGRFSARVELQTELLRQRSEDRNAARISACGFAAPSAGGEFGRASGAHSKRKSYFPSKPVASTTGLPVRPSSVITCRAGPCKSSTPHAHTL